MALEDRLHMLRRTNSQLEHSESSAQMRSATAQQQVSMLCLVKSNLMMTNLASSYKIQAVYTDVSDQAALASAHDSDSSGKDAFVICLNVGFGHCAENCHSSFPTQACACR